MSGFVDDEAIRDETEVEAENQRDGNQKAKATSSKKVNDDDSEDSENDEHIPNHFENDGFVVDEEEEEESYKRPRELDLNRRKKRKLIRNDQKKHDEKENKELAAEVADLMQDQQNELHFDMEERAERKKQRAAEPSAVENDEENDDDFIEYPNDYTRPSGDAKDHEAQEIFGGEDEILNEIGDTYRDRDGDEEHMDDDQHEQQQLSKYDQMRQVYGEEVMRERFLTERDDEIRGEDIPERIQVNNIHRTVTDQELEQEAEWIYEYALKEKIIIRCEELSRTYRVTTEQAVFDAKKAALGVIREILSFYLRSYIDVPAIARYRKEHFQHTFSEEEDIWTIIDWDEKWLTLSQRRKQTEELFVKAGASKVYIDLLAEAKTLEDVFDFQNYYHFRYGSSANNASSQQLKLSNRRDRYAQAKKLKADIFAQKFGMSAAEYGENLASSWEKNAARDSDKDPFEEAAPFVTKILSSEQMLELARFALAHEIAQEPIVRQKVRGVYENFASISTKPTQKGELSVFEGSDSIKSIKSMQLAHAMFRNLDRARKDQYLDQAEQDILKFLRIIKAERDGFIEVSFSVENDDIDNALSAQKLFYSDKSNHISQAWNKQRQSVIQNVKTMLHPIMEKHVRNYYSKKAEELLALKCQQRLRDMLMVGPCGHVHPSEQSQIEPKPFTPTKCRVLACCPPIENEVIAFVMLDMDGRLIETMHWKTIFSDRVKIDKYREGVRDKQRSELQAFIAKHKPDVVAIALTGVNSKHINVDVSSVISMSGLSISVHFVPDDVAKIYEASKKSAAEFPELRPVYRRAISIGRRLNDPLSEIANLYDTREILFLRFHPQQDMLSKDFLLQALEKTFISVVNRVGVSINRIIQHEHLQAVLRFVCGLGPRKAAQLIKGVLDHSQHYLSNRKELLENNLLGKLDKCTILFMNCAGFIRVRNETEDESYQRNFFVLDDTRIHPESYDLARKMAIDAIEEDNEDDEREDDDEAITQVMKDSTKLDDLDLDAYADALEKGDMGKKHVTLQDIKAEYKQPFADPRYTYKDLSPKDCFYAIIDEPEDNFKENKVVNCTIEDVGKSVIVRLENGLEGHISRSACEDNANYLSKGMTIEAVIKNIDFTQIHITLSALKQDLDVHKEDEPVAQRKKHRRSRAHRNIDHPNFKNFSYEQAVKYLEDKQPGEVVIRPSSKADDHLTITFKFFANTFINLDIQEGKKVDRFSLGKELYIQDQKYEDLDEVCFRYVSQVIDHAKKMTEHPKFSNKTLPEIEQLLRADKQKHPQSIPYVLSLKKDMPGYFDFAYLPSNRVKHERIRVCPDGFVYSKRTFESPDKVINALKNAFKEKRERKHQVVHRQRQEESGSNW